VNKSSSLFLKLHINFALLFVRKMMAKDSCMIDFILFDAFCG
jgi:hypothetical protein